MGKLYDRVMGALLAAIANWLFKDEYTPRCDFEKKNGWVPKATSSSDNDSGVHSDW